MRALQVLLLILFSALVLTACGEYAVGPPPPPDDQTDPDDTNNGNVDAPNSPGPEVLWVKEFGTEQSHRPHLLGLAITDQGRVFFSGARRLDGPDDPLSAVQPYLMEIDATTGRQLDKHTVSEINHDSYTTWVLPFADDSVMTLGTDIENRTYVQRISNSAGDNWQHELDGYLNEATVGPDNTVFVHGGRSPRDLWNKLLDETGRELWSKPYEPVGWRSQTIVATYNESNNAFLILRRSGEKVRDCAAADYLESCREGVQAWHYYVDIIDANTGTTRATRELFQSQNHVIEDMVTDASGNVYLAGYYRDSETHRALLARTTVSSVDADIDMMIDNSGMSDNLYTHITLTREGNLLLAGWTNDMSGGWPNQKGAGPAFLVEFTPELEREWVHRVDGAPGSTWTALIGGHHPDVGYLLAGLGGNDNYFLVAFSPEVE